MADKNTKYLIVIGGATATGKTTAAIKLASVFKAPILSADSRQFYKEMNIGTAKPSAAEQTAAVHHFVDFLSVGDTYSVGDFERDAIKLLEEIFSTADIAILAGGSGLFLQAVCEGLDVFPVVSKETKAQVSEGEQSGGLPWLQQQVASCDPEYFKQADQQNPARLRRALEIYTQSKQPYSSFLGRNKPPRSFTPIYLLLERPRQELYRRIDARVDKMISAGLEQEAKALLPYRSFPALRTVGYNEWFEHFDGKLSHDEAIEKIKQHSRNYAKRQATWFRKHGNWKAFQSEDWANMYAFVCKQMKPQNTA